MNARLTTTLIKKDLTLFVRDRFYFLITVIGLILYVVIYWIMPANVDEELEIALFIPEQQQSGTFLDTEHGIKVTMFSTEDALQEAIKQSKYSAGVVIPEDFLSLIATGQKPRVTLYFSPQSSEELREAIKAMISRAAFMTSGIEDKIELKTEIIGNDMIGRQIPLRDRFIPLLLIAILGTEVLSLASLISTELTQNTVSAILATPVKLSHLLSAKAIMGMTMAFCQTVLFMLIIRGFSHEPLAVFMSLLLGSTLITGLGFLVAAMARDMMGVTSWGMIMFVIFVIPAIGTLFPGLISDWAKVLPSYHLIDAVSKLVSYHASFAEIKGDYFIMLGWSAVSTTAGVLTLRRRYR